MASKAASMLTFTTGIASAVVLLCVFAALFGPWIAPYSESEMFGAVWGPPSAEHWLGLDNIGRDML